MDSTWNQREATNVALGRQGDGETRPDILFGWLDFRCAGHNIYQNGADEIEREVDGTSKAVNIDQIASWAWPKTEGPYNYRDINVKRAWEGA